MIFPESIWITFSCLDCLCALLFLFDPDIFIYYHFMLYFDIGASNTFSGGSVSAPFS